MTVYIVTGSPLQSYQKNILGIYETIEDAKTSVRIHEQYGYSKLEIKEADFYIRSKTDDLA